MRLSRISASMLSFATVILVSTLPLVAQESPRAKRSEKSDGAASKQDSSRRVPRYFGQIGLTPDQRDSIYAIQAKHQPKIDALEKQLAALQGQVLTECEGVLSATQKQLLEQRRKAAVSTKKSNAPAKDSEK